MKKKILQGQKRDKNKSMKAVSEILKTHFIATFIPLNLGSRV